MTRDISTANQGADQVRHDITIVGDVKGNEGHQGFVNLVTLLQTVLQQPDLLRHAAECPEAVRVIKNGNDWVLESVCLAPKGDAAI